MKQFSKLFFAAAVAALGLASCAKEVAPVETTKDNLVTVHFGATAGIEGATKATLTTEDELTFTSAWENEDELSVKYSLDFGETKETTASWLKDKSCFEAQLEGDHGDWMYDALYPKPSVVSFGSTRTQEGNTYNSKYDLMKGSATAEGADAGKTADGKDIIFNMTRQTAIAYFHLTSKLDEEVVSAKLSVDGDGAYLSTSEVKANEDYAQGYTFTETEGVASKEINLTFTGEAPRSSDFKLWFNVLPTIYDKMTLTVETTNNTLTISRKAKDKNGDLYEAGKLYKVVKEIPAEKWAPKAAYTGGDLVFDFKTHPKDWPAEENKNAGNYDYELSGVKYAFNLSTNVYCKGTSGNNGYLMISGKNDNALLGLPAISGFKLTKIVATINDQVTTVSSKTMVAITDGVNVVAGGVAQNWKTKGAVHTYTLTETEENTVYYMYATKANAQMMKLVLSYEPATPSAPKHSVSFASVDGGTLSASAIKAEEGTEITLTAEPQLGYEFNSDWSVVAADGTAINVVDNKFTMPAQDVTVSGTFSKVAYTITKVTAENGSFIVKNGDAEVTTAFKGDKLTLEATPVEGFTFSNWNVTYKDGETEQTVNVNANAFYMPAANVTVSATFVEAAQVPVYASVADLITAGTPTKDGTKVTVTLMDEEIIRFHTLKDGTVAGAIIKVGTQEVEIFCKGTPSDWKVGGTISGTLTNCVWKLYYSTWELCPADYSELTYKAPLPTCATPVITIAEGGVVSIACETAGATIHYTVGDSPADPAEADAVFGAVTLTDGQTIKAIAVAEGFKPSAVASKKYTVGGAESTLVWDDDFSSLTKANTTALKSLNGSKTGFKDAYTIANCYPEVSSIKMSSGRTIGSLQTPKFTKLSGSSSVVVTVEYAGYGTDGGTLNLSVVGNGTLSVESLTATNTATKGAEVKTWDKATFVISGADKSTALKLTASAKGKRFFINSIKIETK